MKVVAVDPSLRSAGVCVLVDGVVITKTLTSDPKDPMDVRLHGMWRHFESIARRHADADVAAIEGYAFGKFSNSSSITVLVEVVAVARIAFAGYGIPVVQLANQLWKSLTMGARLRGHKKATVSERQSYCEEVRKVWGWQFATTDEADAFLIAKAAERIIRGVSNPSDAVLAIRQELSRRGVTMYDAQRELCF
jgi:hypothetical protein